MFRSGVSFLPNLACSGSIAPSVSLQCRLGSQNAGMFHRRRHQTGTGPSFAVTSALDLNRGFFSQWHASGLELFCGAVFCRCIDRLMTSSHDDPILLFLRYCSLSLHKLVNPVRAQLSSNTPVTLRMSATTSMESKLSSLHIDLPPSSNPKSGTKKEDVVDSWEDDVNDDETYSRSPIEGPGPSLKPVKSLDPALGPPPPTPISPDGQYIDWSPAQAFGGGRPSTRPFTPQSDPDRERRRPEKTTATASRMIAAGLGIKPQKKTEEQKHYDRALKEQEIKRRNREKDEKERDREADEKAKASVWDS